MYLPDQLPPWGLTARYWVTASLFAYCTEPFTTFHHRSLMNTIKHNLRVSHSDSSNCPHSILRLPEFLLPLLSISYAVGTKSTAYSNCMSWEVAFGGDNKGDVNLTGGLSSTTLPVLQTTTYNRTHQGTVHFLFNTHILLLITFSLWYEGVYQPL